VTFLPRYSPPPNDIIWENISEKQHWVMAKKVVANLFIFIVAFFLTTPQFVVHQLDPIMNALKNLAGELKPFNQVPTNQRLHNLALLDGQFHIA